MTKPLQTIADFDAELRSGRCRDLTLVRCIGWLPPGRGAGARRLAQLTGLHPATIRAWETGRTKNPRPETARRIREALMRIARSR